MVNKNAFTVDLDMNRVSCENMHKTIIKLFLRDVFAHFRFFLSFSDFMLKMKRTAKEMATRNELNPKKARFVCWGLLCPLVPSTINDHLHGDESHCNPPQ